MILNNFPIISDYTKLYTDLDWKVLPSETMQCQFSIARDLFCTLSNSRFVTAQSQLWETFNQKKCQMNSKSEQTEHSAECKRKRLFIMERTG